MHRVTVPGIAGHNLIAEGLGRRLLIEMNRSSDPNSLFWFNPITGAIHYILHAPANVIGVVGVMPFGNPIPRG